MNKSIVSLYIGGATLVLALLGVVVYKSASADGSVVYCYTNWQTSSGPIKGYWDLYGYRRWRPDRLIGSFTSMDEVISNARQQNCNLNIEARP